MFDFQKLSVYQKALQFNRDIVPVLSSLKDRTINDQLKRAALSIVLNISEGTSRFSNSDRKRFYIISRGSTYESAALLEYLLGLNLIKKSQFKNLITSLEEISKMLFSMIRQLE